MWWSSKNNGSTEIESEPLTIPVATPIQRTMVGEVELAEYIKLAENVGFAPGELLQARVLNFLRENNIDVYPTDAVYKYLDGMFGKSQGFSSRTWGWRPLRPEDDGRLSNDMSLPRDSNGEILQDRYHQIIPAPVLETVVKIATEFKVSDPELHFYVSDKVRPSDKRDPFLAVTALGMGLIIIERWDEPSFRR